MTVDRERKRAWNRAWYTRHRSEVLDRCRSYYQRNRERVLLRVSEYQARKKKPALSVEERFWSQVHKGDGCWLFFGRRGKVHPYAAIWINGSRTSAHRFVFELTKGPIPAGMFVCHTCDNPTCVRPDHLFLGTAADNVHDMLAKGRANPPHGDAHPWRRHPELVRRAEANPNSKLTTPAVREIRTAWSQRKTSQRALADRYGVSPSLISKVVHRWVWRSV